MIYHYRPPKGHDKIIKIEIPQRIHNIMQNECISIDLSKENIQKKRKMNEFLKRIWEIFHFHMRDILANWKKK